MLASLGDADILRVIGHAHEVERRVDPDVEAHRVLDGFALGVLVGVARAGDAVAHHPGVDRPAGVEVRLAEVRIALEVGLLRSSGRERGRRRGRGRRGDRLGSGSARLLRGIVRRGLLLRGGWGLLLLATAEERQRDDGEDGCERA